MLAEFTIPVIKTVYHESENISFLDPKIWNALPGWRTPIA